MENLPIDGNRNLLPLELWKGEHYRALWQLICSLTDKEEAAWDVFADVLTQTLLYRDVSYPCAADEPDPAPDADENISWPFSEEDELRHKRMLLVRAIASAERHLHVLDGQLELLDHRED